MNKNEAIAAARQYFREHAEEVLKNEMLQAFSKRKEEINVYVNVNQKNPLIKEYLKLYNEAEKKPYTKIGRMAQNMRAITAQQEVLKKAAELCEDEKEKKAHGCLR